MPTQRLSMRRIREVLRLRHQGLTERVIARTLGVSNGVVHGYVRRARLAGLTWPLPEGLDDEGLELLLFPAPTAASQSDRRPSPDWAYVEKELRRRSVTRLLLWEEYRAANPDGFGYTWFCTTFEAWKQRAQACQRRLDRPQREPARHRGDRARQKLDCLRPWPQGLPRQSFGPVSPRPALVRGARPSSRRRPIWPTAQNHRPGSTPDPR